MAGRNDDERIREIISLIMDNDQEDAYDSGNIYTRLEDMGYSSEEIRRAMLLLDVDSVKGGILAEEGFGTGTRILSPAERSMLSLEAQGWLLWLRSAGWISETHMSLIIESAGLEFRAPASLEEVMEIAFRYEPSIPERSEDEDHTPVN
ncbi:MAG TPA: DUF494 family protein [Candidatus Eisenbacteria bacterium]|uniref:DUF494 family protein n=1 Tax=Eiseniibacteriota bacterium TaxID=2212470 RepID=A0A7V2AUB1_UNCEI|nr:DUF494 family protein [Candidatus Eisenbacteria bacterium]